MPKLTKKEILHVANLSKLKLKDIEIPKFADQLSSIIDFIGELSKVNTDGVDPMNQTTGLTNIYRDDEVKVQSILTCDEALSGTEQVYNGLIKVPAILSERSDK
jgi:aspartyl-tRNA(Asn)/glutamyl-tRNA(Gln) amidotransferase subunit C